MTTEELEALARRLAYSDGCGPHPDHGACEANHKHMREILQALKDVRRETREEDEELIQAANTLPWLRRAIRSKLEQEKV